MARERLCDIAIGSSRQFEGLLESGNPVLAFFHMDGDVWKQAVEGLRRSRPILDYLDDKGIKVVSVDINRNIYLAAMQGALTSPHVMAFDVNGAKQGEVIGYSGSETLLDNLAKWYG